MIANILLTTALLAAPPELETAPSPNSVEAQRVNIVKKGLDFLHDKGQGADGAISPKAGSGITSLAIVAVLRNGFKLNDPL